MRKIVAIGALGLASTLIVGCGKSDAPQVGKPFTQVPVEMTAKLQAPVKIGVLYSVKGQGSDWWRAAGGAEVAAYRLRLGGAKVTLDAIDDQGNAAKATAAIKTMIADGVSGVVVASDGHHLDGALAAASAAKLPVVLPYYAPAKATSGVWSLAPTSAQVGAELGKVLASSSRRSPLVIEGQGETVPGVTGGQRFTFTGQNASVLSDRLGQLMKSQSIDSVVLTGDAATQAAALRVVQGWSEDGKSSSKQFTYPVVLTPHALSPVFAQDLVNGGGVLDGTFSSAGLPVGQMAALGQTQEGLQLASFYSAVKMAGSAGTSSVTALNGTEFGSDDELASDSVSHDAVVALVRAAQAAKSVHAADVLEELGSLSLGAAQGLAGPALTFTSALQPYAKSPFVPLSSTPSGPNLLSLPAADPKTNFIPLYWFASSTAVALNP